MPPRVSVVMSAYRASATIGRSLAALDAQTYSDFEVVVVDSSPDDSVARIVAGFPRVRFERSLTRLYCHEARNRAIALANGELLACLDADVYARPDWLAKMVAAHDRSGQVIVGAIACHGRSLRDRAIHLCKFSKFLPGGVERIVDTGPTANLLLSRVDFERAGGFNGDLYLADVELGKALKANGKDLVFAPGAIVAHHHTQTTREYFEERFLRGKLFGRMRSRWLLRKRDILFYLAVSVLPIRLLRIAALSIGHAHRGGELRTFALTFPLVLAGHATWLAGEALSYARACLSSEHAKERRAMAGDQAFGKPVERS